MSIITDEIGYVNIDPNGYLELIDDNKLGKILEYIAHEYYNGNQLINF